MVYFVQFLVIPIQKFHFIPNAVFVHSDPLHVNKDASDLETGYEDLGLVFHRKSSETMKKGVRCL